MIIYSNSSVIITCNTNSLASDITDDSITGIHHVHEELVSEKTSIDRINRKHHDLIQSQFHTSPVVTVNRILIPTTSS